jgi:group I intron endonuclease
MMIIYCLTNLINRKRYIGLTKLEVSKRIAQHATAASLIGCAIRKYGIQSFKISVIDTAATYEVLQEKERFWIAHFKSIAPRGYNLTSGGDGNHDMPKHIRLRMGRGKGIVQSDEEKKKRSASLLRFYADEKRSEEARKKIAAVGHARKGCKLTAEYRQHLSDVQRGTKRGPMPLETRLKIAKANLGIRHTPEVLQRISAKLRGRSSWNKGRSWTEDERKVLSEAHKGHIASEETRQKMSIAQIARRTLERASSSHAIQ